MKTFRFIFLIIGIFYTINLKAQQGLQTNDSTEMVFNEIDHNFGTIPHRGNGTFEFEFKNTGKKPLIIKHVQSTCGCSTPSWDSQPIPPKGKGKVVVKYDTERIGTFIKTIKVFSNAKNSPIDLTIRGEVKVSN